MTFQSRHILLAVILHVLLFGILAGGAHFTRKIPPTRVIEAVLYDPSRQQAEQRKRQDTQRKQDVERKRREDAEQKKRQQEETERKTKVEAERQEKIETERRQKEAQAKLKLEQEQQKKAADADAKKKAADQAKKEQQEKRERADQEKRSADMQAQMRREIEQENLRRQMQLESDALQENEINAGTNQWGLLVSRHIQKNWIRPGSSNADFSCNVQVQLLPDGTVTSARITRTCGSSALDKSVEDAVFRSSPIPRPANPTVFTRDLTIVFVPR